MFENSSEIWAIGILSFYLVTGIAITLWKMRSWTDEWKLLALYCVNRIYVPLMFHWRSNRACPWPKDGSVLVLANHRSPVDPMLLWMDDNRWNRKGPIRPIRFLMAQEYYYIKGVHWIGRTMKAIPVDRSAHDAKPVMRALRILKENQLVGVFPEGGINEHDGIREGSPGVAFLALKSKAPVYPAFVRNAPQTKSMVRCFYKPQRVEVIYGDPIDLSRFEGKKITQEILKEACDYMMSQLAELGGVPYNGHQCPLHDQDETQVLSMKNSVG